jgi:hypothetical protein
LWILSNVASSTSFQANAVIEAGAVPLLIQLVGSSNEGVSGQAVWALANLCGDGHSTRDLVVSHGIILKLVELLD